MTILQLYIYSNIYILFFWVFYKIFLQKTYYFKTNRIYFVLAILISVIIPIIQNKIVQYPKIEGAFADNLQAIKFIYISVGNSFAESSINTTYPTIDWSNIFTSLIIIGSLVTLSRTAITHFMIKSLIKKSDCIKHGNIKVIICEENIVPFIYNNFIIISNSIPIEERQLIIHHESLHYKFGHQFDNYLLQVFQILFWINPFFNLLKRDLKQVHEYQVDNKIISSGIDATNYKLTLIKFSVGYQKFAIANGLTNSKIKNRIIMMNDNIAKKGKWKYTLLIPSLCFVFITLSFTNMKPDLWVENIEQSTSISQKPDSVSIELITIPLDEFFNNKENYITVYINSESQLLINGKKTTIQDVTNKVYNSYESKITEEFGEINSDLTDNLSSKTKILVRKSRYTDKNDYDELLNQVSSGIYRLQELYSKKVFGKSYKLLTASNKEVINKLIQPKIYIAPDKKI